MNTRASSISRASKNAPGEVRAALEQHRLHVDRARAPGRPAATRAGSVSPRTISTSTPAASSAGHRGARGRARADDGDRRLAQPTARGRSSSGSRASASNTTRRGWRYTPSTRAVSSGSSDMRGADPHGHGVALGAPAVGACAAGVAGDPLRVAAAGRDLAVERHRRLPHDQRPAGLRVLAERLVDEAGRRAAGAVADVDRDALVAQDPEAAAVRLVRTGRRSRPPRGRSRPRRSPRCRAGCGRGGRTARARRTSSRRPGPRCRRRAPRARRAARRRRRGSPRRSCGRS